MKKIAVLVFFVLSALFAGILAEKLMRSDEISKSDETGETVAKQEEVKEAGNGRTEKIGGLEWSELFSFDYDIFWRKAFEYCENLEKNGHTDWRLPNIDELRTIIKNCPATESGGMCKVSEEKDCLSEECRESCSCEMKEDNGGYYSRLGDSLALWSNTPDPASSDNALVVDFKSAGVDSWSKTENFTHRIRCVRQDEHEMCETAKRYAVLYYWNFYLKHFPNGECAEEAKVFLDNEDEKKCAAARTQNTRASWEQYLRIFPNGKCAEEGKSIVKKFRKIGGLEWSDIFYLNKGENDGEEPQYYCQHFRKGGYDDWRLPNIEELRMLVQNHPGTISDGDCRISENKDDLTESCSGIEGSDFSKFGDKERLLSSSAVDVDREYMFWTLDFSNGGIDTGSMMWEGVQFRCVRQDDADACREARKDFTGNLWKRYLEDFPEGKCAEEAKAGPEDEALCTWARGRNLRADWEFYLKKFPNGKCAEEAKSVRNKFKRIGNLEWSDRLYNNLCEDLCEELIEDGHSDWRKPNIDELRTLIINNPNTVTGGICPISESLSESLIDDWENYDVDFVETLKSYKIDYYEECGGTGGKNFSKLGDTGRLISSTSFVEYYHGMWRVNWAVSFDNGRLEFLSPDCGSRRCVRQDDLDACKTAQTYGKLYYWRFYFENYPKGKCAAEAKNFLKKRDKEACDNAKIENSKENWRSYLQDFPKGRCVKEAKKALEKLSCEQARKESYTTLFWEVYLRDYPEGMCAKEAKSELKRMQEENEREACEKGRKYSWEWKNYLRDYPKGKCAKEAETELKRLYKEEDHKDCEDARKKDGSREMKGSWRYYLENYPEGECVAEAKAGIDQASCRIAKEENSLVSWTSYLKEYPDGKCSEEAKTAIKKMKKVGNLEWSDISKEKVSWKNAVDYCKQLREDGHSDWRLPDIDELRTIVQNCPNTETGAICKVSRKNGCLSGKCLNDDESCGCIFKWGSFYSKFGDDNWIRLWSSSVNPDDATYAWRIDFSSGWVKDYNKSSLNHVRCVR